MTDVENDVLPQVADVVARALWDGKAERLPMASGWKVAQALADAGFRVTPAEVTDA